MINDADIVGANNTVSDGRDHHVRGQVHISVWVLLAVVAHTN